MNFSYNPTSRIAVIEIGSRAVRLMVADVSSGAGFKIVNTAWEETYLAAAMNEGGDSLRKKLDIIEKIVKRFKGVSDQLKVVELCIFGTAAFREMPATFVEYFRNRVPELQILDKMAESGCSLIGAINEFKAFTSTGSQLVIDQGAGSTEIVLGQVTPAGVTLVDFRSYSLGTQTLVQTLAKKGHDLKKFQSLIEKTIAGYKLVGTTFTGRPVILGSVATKVAWIKVRKYPEQKYDPAIAHGHIIDLKTIDAIINLAIKDPDAVQCLISPHSRNMADFELFITGLIALAAFLKRLGKDDFKVSAFGTRFGVIWMLALYHKIAVTKAKLGDHTE